jgi:endonuclease/exonuclease/phosphatase family metal-dependent hydrolase
MCAGFLVLVLSSGTAAAQTTVTLRDPGTQVVWATIRAGSYANTNIRSLLATRRSDTSEYGRRALLKFDTQNTIPAGSTVTSALLTVTVKTGGADPTRNIGVYQVKSSWTEDEVTWNIRKTSLPWVTSGGDLGTKLAQRVVSNVAGSRVTFDVTALVKQAVSGSLGSSRYTRVEFIDLDASTSASYREYYLPNDSNTANRPVLKVTYGKSSTTTTSTSSGTSIRVLHWNTHHGGLGTDGVLDSVRLIKKAASFNPDVISFNEVEMYTSWGNRNDPALFASLLKQYTGRTYYYKFATATGASTGNGNLVLSRFPIAAASVHYLSYKRSAVDVMINVNGRYLNITSTHLDNSSTSDRLTQISQLTTWASGLAEQRIICGDFNAWPTTIEISTMKQKYYDAWAEAVADGTDITYPGNTSGDTRGSRIDFIFRSHGASYLVLKSMQVYDVRDANGVMPSDHRPILAVFTVR